MRLYSKHIYSLFFYCFLAINGLHAQLEISKPVLQWNQEGITIRLKDELNHPFFSWPMTALQYQIDFGANGILEKELGLIETSSGKNQPFQLVDQELKNGRIQKATLVFLSDLPTGGNKLFRLASAINRPINLTTTETTIVTVDKTETGYILSNCKIKIEIPSPKEIKITAPIKRYGNSSKWLGYGEMPTSLSVSKMTVTELSNGPVQAIYQIIYDLPPNKKYVVKLKLTAGMEFVEMDETMNGFDIKENAIWKMVWNGIALDHRYASTRGEKIDNKKNGFENIAWEPMEGLPSNPTADKHPLADIDQRNASDGKLPFRIAPYDNWMTWWRLPTAAFWSEKEDLTIGLFIKDMEKWNDGLYSLWGSKGNLNIYFHWNKNVLDYTFSLVNGTRSTALTAYTHVKDKELINKNNNAQAYVDYLRHWYGWTSLDKVKDWTLDYAAKETGYPRYFKPENSSPTTTLSVLENSLSNALKGISSGTERINGPNPVGSRIYYDIITPAFDLNAANMNPEQYKRLRAWYLFVAYLYMDETLMPMRTMLSGHPNFLGDIKGTVGMAAFLFPKHPQANLMADHFEKFVQLNLNYSIRPAVPAWEALGGRWTENLATYTWAAIKPMLRTSYLLHHDYDGKNRFMQSGVSMYGNWLLNAISSPLINKNNRRVYPPQGAHAHAYGEGPPNALRLLAQETTNFDPLLSEHIFWITTAEDNPFESNKDKDKPWGEMLKGQWASNHGTNPHLKSEKFTGYGFVLRSGFGTKDEMFVNLQQIDEGPNYRWGRAANGGNGVVYYYAQGKRYSHNGTEDVGDGPFGDVERISNFGVKKAGGYRSMGPYRSVGRNELTEPLYDFGFAQFATVKGNADIANDYRSRSVLQSGADYIAVYDDVANETMDGRFSWFVGTEDSFPSIFQVQPGANFVDADIKPSKSNYHKDPDVMPTKGRYYDGKGSFLTIITHKSDVKVTKASFGCIVEKSNNAVDFIFRSAKTIVYQKDEMSFTGTAGIIQKINEKTFAAALFNGSSIAIPGVKVDLGLDNQAAIGLKTLATGFGGQYQSRKSSTALFTSSQANLVFYLDGIVVAGKSPLQVTISAGKHTWQWISAGYVPEPTTIIGTEIKSKSVTLNWTPVSGATAYQLEMSKDGGENWTISKENILGTNVSLSDLANGSKIHLRVLTIGKGGNGAPSNEYPAYISDQIPHAPEGLKLDLNGPQIKITWGQILGAGQYQLYRRVKTASGKTDFQKIYTGIDQLFIDPKPSNGIIYEYVVTALNGNGESQYSSVADTDPASFLNWEPKAGEGFRRDTEDHENGFIEFDPFQEDKKPILTYPINKK